MLVAPEGSTPDDALLLLPPPIAAEFATDCLVTSGGPVLFPEVVWFLVDTSSTPSIGVCAISVVLSPLGPSVSAMATTDTGRTDGTDGRGMAWTEMALSHIYIYI